REGLFATAVVTTFFAPSRRLMVCNAGHPRPILYRAAQRQWDFLSHEGTAKSRGPRNLPLGMLDITEYEQFDVELEPGDCLLSYTDALIESRDAEGEMLGEEGLLGLVRTLGDLEPQKFAEALITAIESCYPENLSEDDATVLVVRATGRAPRYSFGEKARAAMRLAASLIGAMD